MSPHLQIWRWHTTMLVSILHRLSGSALVAGMLLFAAWLVALSLGREVYTLYLSFAASPFGLLVWFGLSFAGFLHFFGGLRHAIWDLGLGLAPKAADALAAASIWLSVLSTAVLWACLFIFAKVSL
jgi:succinate dehydrogenase / fumarate reductase, cytochrome b subunit